MALMVASCKTQQKAVEKETVETEINVQADEAKTQSSVTELSENEDLEFNQTITFWSEPDSTGKQHPLKTIDTSAKKKKERNLNKAQTENKKRSTTVQKREKKNKDKKNEVTVADAGHDVMTYVIVLMAVTAVIIYIRKR